MKKNFSMLLLRLGGAVAILGAAAFLLMLLVKLLITGLVLFGMGTLVWKMASGRRRQGFRNSFAQLSPNPVQRFSDGKIQPIFSGKASNKTIIPIL